MSASIVLKNRTRFLEDIRKESGQNVNLCYQCKKCTAGCPVADEMDLTPTQVMHAIRLGQRNTVLDSRTIWVCSSCETCTTRCPQDVDIARVMDASRILASREGETCKVPDIPAFHKSMLENIRIFGRMYELGLVGTLKMRTFKFTQDMFMGIRMFLKGKLKLMPKIAGVIETNRIFSRIEEIEKAKK